MDAEAARQEMFQGEVLGFLEVNKSLRKLSSAERFSIAKECHDFTTQMNGKLVRSSVMGLTVQETLTRVDNHELVSRFSPALVGMPVKLIISSDVLKLYCETGATQLVCLHSRSTMGAIAAPGPGGALVYVGHEEQSGMRLAVVLNMGDRAHAKAAAASYNSHASNDKSRKPSSASNQHSSSLPEKEQRHGSSGRLYMQPPSGDGGQPASAHSNTPSNSRRTSAYSNTTSNSHHVSEFPKMDSPVDGISTPDLPPRMPVQQDNDHPDFLDFPDHDYENDPFYDSLGFDCEEQEKLYDPPEHINSKESQKPAKKHLLKFVENEQGYCRLLDGLIEIRNSSLYPKFKYALQELDRMRKIHEKLYMKIASLDRDISIGSVSEAFIDIGDELKCYINYIRSTQAIEEILKGKTDAESRKLQENVIVTRKRCLFYLQILQTWMDYTSSSQSRTKLEEAITTIQQICKYADMTLIVNAVQNCPYTLRLYMPLIRHGNFIVEGKGFKKGHPYKVLLFKDLLLFALSSQNHILCVDALRIEKIVIVNTRSMGKETCHKITLKVNHSRRRGSETIQLIGSSEQAIGQWQSNITELHANMLQQVKEAREY